MFSPLLSRWRAALPCTPSLSPCPAALPGQLRARLPLPARPGPASPRLPPAGPAPAGTSARRLPCRSPGPYSPFIPTFFLSFFLNFFFSFFFLVFFFFLRKERGAERSDVSAQFLSPFRGSREREGAEFSPLPSGSGLGVYVFLKVNSCRPGAGARSRRGRGMSLFPAGSHPGWGPAGGGSWGCPWSAPAGPGGALPWLSAPGKERRELRERHPCLSQVVAAVARRWPRWLQENGAPLLSGQIPGQGTAELRGRRGGCQVTYEGWVMPGVIAAA